MREIPPPPCKRSGSLEAWALWDGKPAAKCPGDGEFPYGAREAERDAFDRPLRPSPITARALGAAIWEVAQGKVEGER